MPNLQAVSLPAQTTMKPRNVEQIVQAAKEYEYNAQVPVRYWLRTASALLKEADIYMREGDDETTYLLLFRHAHLVLAHLEAHPGARDPAIKPLLAQARREVDRNLRVLDILKPKINQRYDRYQKIVKEREERRFSQPRTSVDEHTTEEDTRSNSKRKIHQLHGHEDSDLAVRLAQQEFQRRAHSRDISSPSIRRRSADTDDLSRRLQAIRTRVDPNGPREDSVLQPERKENHHADGYKYPSIKVQRQHPSSEYGTLLPAPSYSANNRVDTIPPSLPPKPGASDSSSLPPRPEKVSSLNRPEPGNSKPSADTTYTFAPSAFLEGGNPLRTLFLPPTLRTTFLRLAYKNTKANLETCGFLAGTLISNALFVSKLIIPAQVATSDTCEMTNESQLFDYVDSGADLMILGWIHTHPSQTCFMSSRDLHTHAGYQMMLPESVAIVCAPSKGDTSHGGDWGVFRLTDPPGKMAILNCTKPGIFHPHDVDNVYTDALRPGHVVEARGLEFEVVDLRDT